MKINWGVFAFSLFGVFVVFMLGMVYFATKQNNELVTENYYEKELEFKEILKKKNQSNQLKEGITYLTNSTYLSLVFPKEIENEISGTVVFYKPSSKSADKTFDIKVVGNTQQFSLTNFAKGMYRVKIDWKADRKEYYNEIDIVIP